jgi:hypothetical protein
MYAGPAVVVAVRRYTSFTFLLYNKYTYPICVYTKIFLFTFLSIFLGRIQAAPYVTVGAGWLFAEANGVVNVASFLT